MIFSQRINTVLIENNPYDRAVIDAALQDDSNLILRFSDPRTSRPFDLDPLGWRAAFDGNKPHIALLDLALSAECEEQIPSSGFQTAIKDARGILPALAIHLEQSQRAMLPLVQTTYLICKAITADGESRLKALRSLGSLQLSKRLKRSIEPVLEALQQKGRVSQSVLDSALKSLWGGDAKARLAKTITQAPSLWRILIAIAQNPDVCFFIVSHYVNDTFSEPLQDLLGARRVAPSSDPEFYREFLITKSDLSNLSDRIRRGYDKWQKLSLSAVIEPFSMVPVFDSSNGSFCTLRELLSFWQNDHLSQEINSPQLLLWDDTATLNRGEFRWESIMRPWANSPVVIQAESPDVLIGEDKDILLINKAVFWDVVRANQWAVKLREVFAQRRKDGWETIVIAGGSDTSRVAVNNVLGNARQYKIPPLHLWDASLIRTLLERLPVVTDDDGVRITLWDNQSTQEASSLEDFLNRNTKAPKPILNRVITRLKRESERPPVPDAVGAVLPLLDRICHPLEPLLMALKVTAGPEQDWEYLCDQHQFTSDFFWKVRT